MSPSPGYPRNLIEAIDAGAGLTEHGFTFLGNGGAECFLSFDGLRREAIRRGHHLEARGLRKGERLALVVPEGADFVPTFFGAVWAGAIPVPLYPPFSLGNLDAYLDGLAATLGKARPALLCTSKRVASVLWSVVARVPSLRGIVLVEDLSADVSAVDETPPAVSDAELAFLQFTSGSTAAPKGVMVTHGNVHANCRGIMEQGLRVNSAEDVGVSWLPLYHDMGLVGFVLAPVFHKTPVVFLSTLGFIKNPGSWLQALHDRRGSITFAPNFAYALAAKRIRPEQVARWDLSSVRVLGCGAEPIHPGILRTFLEALRPAGLRPEAILPCYGMAEATLAVSFVGLDETLRTDHVSAEACEVARRATPPTSEERAAGRSREVVCCGRAFQGHEIAVLDGEERPLPERHIGEIAVRGPSVASGYYDDERATTAVFRDGWLRTGDLGYLAAGELFVTGRKKDLVIVNGRNYDPHSIEWIVDDVAGIRRGSAVAFSRPGAATEELVVVAEARRGDVERVRAVVRERVYERLQLAVSDLVLVSPGALPKTSSGKAQRQKIRAQYLGGTLGQAGTRGTAGASVRLTVARHLARSAWAKAAFLLRTALRSPR